MSASDVPIRDEIACPFCGETILRQAKKCKHCGEILDRAAMERLRGDLPSRDRPEVVWIGRDLLVPSRGNVRTRRCLLCGGTRDVRAWEMKCAYTPPWVWILIVVGPLVAAIAAAIASKRDTIGLTRCDDCRRAMRRYVVASWALGLGGFFAFPLLGALAGDAFDARDGFAIGMAIGFGVWIVGLIGLAVWGQSGPVRCTKIDELGVLLRLARSDQARRALSELEST